MRRDADVAGRALLTYGKVLLPLAGGILLAAVVATIGPGLWGGLAEKITSLEDTTAFDQMPVLAGTLECTEDGAALQPYAVALASDSLYVSFLNSDRVDVFSRDFARVRTLHLAHDGPSSITGLAVDERHIYVADLTQGEIRFHDRSGRLLQAFSWLPNKAGRLRPHGLHLFRGNLYVTDVDQRQLLVISVSAAPGIAEEGELLYAIPGPGGDTTLLHCPAGAAVTEDGRVLVTDIVHRAVMAFTCSGRYAYTFDTTGGAQLLGPSGIAFDNLPSPELLALDKASFDPSGVRHEGRIHVVDSRAGEIVVYDALGKYVLRYGGGHLRSPNGIAVDQRRRLIIITDAARHALDFYKY